MYFAIKWIVPYREDMYEWVKEFETRTKEVGSILKELPYIPHPLGYLYFDFAIETSSEKNLAIITQNLSDMKGLEEWIPITEEVYQLAEDFDIDKELAVPFISVDYVSNLMQLGEHNSITEDYHRSREYQNLYFQGNWIVCLPIPKTFYLATLQCEKVGASLYYLGFGHNSENYRIIKFGLRITTAKTFEETMNILGLQSEISNWQSITENEFYTNCRKISLFSETWARRVTNYKYIEEFYEENIKVNRRKPTD